MKIVVVGAGYVGLVSAVCFAEFGMDVVCIETNVEKVKKLRSCIPTIYELQLESLLKKNVLEKRLEFSDSLSENIFDADVLFIAVGTPNNPDGRTNLSYVFSVVDQIKSCLNKDLVVVVKSTVPVGTTRKIQDMLNGFQHKVRVVFNPEFLKEGNAIFDFMNPDRIIFGVNQDDQNDLLTSIYKPLINNTEIVFTTFESAELAKYASNSFLATKVAFVNELSDLCEKCGADISEISYAMGLDKRIGNQFLKPGPGFGGMCFHKDTSSLSHFAHDYGADMSIVKQVISSNSKRLDKIAQKIIDACSGTVLNKRIAILGITFKANTDDVRESPSINIINCLLKNGANVAFYDPSVIDHKKPVEIDPFAKCENCSSIDMACKNAEAVVIVTEWNIFKKIDLIHLRNIVKNPIIIDFRNIYEPSDVRKNGFSYISVGRN